VLTCLKLFEAGDYGGVMSYHFDVNDRLSCVRRCNDPELLIEAAQSEGVQKVVREAARRKAVRLNDAMVRDRGARDPVERHRLAVARDAERLAWWEAQTPQRRDEIEEEAFQQLPAELRARLVDKDGHGLPLSTGEQGCLLAGRWHIVERELLLEECRRREASDATS
jgi:hypothetical protein